jgi:hypothetical protein
MAQQSYDSYVVIADFIGTAENELTIKVGDALLVLQATPEGWSEGYTADGRQGWFPSAYAKYNPAGRDDVIEEIKERNEETHPHATSASSSSKQQGSSTSGGGSGVSAHTSQSTVASVAPPARPRSSSGSSSSSSSVGNVAKKISVGGSSSKAASKPKMEPTAGPTPFPGIRLHANEDAGGAFPGIRLRPPPPVGEVSVNSTSGAFPGIRHHDSAASTPVLDKKEEKKKKAEEKKKEKERQKLEKKKEKELKKDLRMASSGLFGVPLKATIVQENHETQIPFIVRCCVGHILKGKHLLREGLFRISGVKTEIDSLKACFEAGQEAQCHEAVQKADIDAVAGVLKQYFRELPDPLFTYAQYGKFVKAGVEKNWALIKVALFALPPGHRETILFMLGFLAKVSQYQDQNKMTEANIGIVFVPTLMRSPSEDENDEPDSLKVAFFYMMNNANSLLQDEPKIHSLLQSFIAENTCDAPVPLLASSSSSSNPSIPPPLASGPSFGALPRPLSSLGIPPPINKS